MHLLCFNLADKEYAVGIESVREVRRIKQVTPIPKALDFIEGVVSLRGRVVPIINLRKKLGLQSAKSASFNRVLITESNNHVLGIAVDSVLGVTAIDKANIEPPDEILKKCEYLTGVGKVAKRLILIIDIEKLLSGEEKSGILEVHKMIEIRKKA
ncbi:MAG: chemotaxis protein CheW [Candidatus Omnitrophica bacterium]|nr:chemotaxis protein CheW [Candidatus Omnitrophota bacterium]